MPLEKFPMLIHENVLSYTHDNDKTDENFRRSLKTFQAQEDSPSFKAYNIRCHAHAIRQTVKEIVNYIDDHLVKSLSTNQKPKTGDDQDDYLLIERIISLATDVTRSTYREPGRTFKRLLKRNLPDASKTARILPIGEFRFYY